MRNLAAALALLAASPPPSPPEHVTLLYTADLGGQLEPCGCSEGQRGGLPRAAAAVARVRRENPATWLVSGGDVLFEGRPSPEELPQALAKARAVAEALRRMGLAWSETGERDLAAGEGFLRETGLPFGPGRRLGPLGVGPIGAVPPAPVRVGVVHAGGTRAALERAGEARRLGIRLLLASHRDGLLDDDRNRALLDAPVPVVQVQGRGQSLARIDLWLRGDLSRGFEVLAGPAQRDEELELLAERRLEYGRRRRAALASGAAELAAALGRKLDELAARERALRRAPLAEPPPDRPSLAVSFLPITPDLPEDREVRAILARAYRAIARENLARARAGGRPCPDPASGEAVYVGADEPPPGGGLACKTCHPGAYAFWRETAHARAFATLAGAGRQYDLDCVSCHVTGWRRPGGACNVAATEGRRDVQCESCHGPASLHARDPPGHLDRQVAEERCRSCHTPEHSTAFDMASYLRRVLGPGHGEGGRR